MWAMTAGSDQPQVEQCGGYKVIMSYLQMSSLVSQPAHPQVLKICKTIGLALN
jgi:hypothetical protein